MNANMLVGITDSNSPAYNIFIEAFESDKLLDATNLEMLV